MKRNMFLYKICTFSKDQIDFNESVDAIAQEFYVNFTHSKLIKYQTFTAIHADFTHYFFFCNS